MKLDGVTYIRGTMMDPKTSSLTDQTYKFDVKKKKKKNLIDVKIEAYFFFFFFYINN